MVRGLGCSPRSRTAGSQIAVGPMEGEGERRCEGTEREGGGGGRTRTRAHTYGLAFVAVACALLAYPVARAGPSAPLEAAKRTTPRPSFLRIRSRSRTRAGSIVRVQRTSRGRASCPLSLASRLLPTSITHVACLQSGALNGEHQLRCVCSDDVAFGRGM